MSLTPNQLQFGCVSRFLNHFSRAKNLRSIQKLHAQVLTTGLLLSSPDIQTKLIFSYAACSHVKDLTHFLKSLDTTKPLPFNALISNFSKCGFPAHALTTLCFMHQSRAPMDTYALCSALTASRGESLDIVGQIHALVIKSGSSSSVFVSGALIDSYSKLSQMSDAQKMFDEVPDKNTICANALLSGYIDLGMWFEGLKLARKLPRLNLSYDHVTLSAMLRACTGASAIELGRQVHGYIVRKISQPELDNFLQSSLIEMYGKCGLAGKARIVFDLTVNINEEKGDALDLVLWTSLLGVCGRNGCYAEVIELYEKMLVKGVRPDEIVFVTVISACARTNRVKLGIDYFESMTVEYRLNPGQEHYSCLVDLLSRAGQLDEALDIICEFIRKGSKDSASMWGALLNACFERGDVELGKLAAQRALEFDPQNVGIYMMLSNLYARFGMWDEIGSLRELIRGRGLKKDTGCSWSFW